MKILKIEIKNFKPFDNISIPSEGYFGEGFFFIKGKNSMGKTSLVEAILWGLFGEQLMTEKDKKMLIKTGESECEVVVTFEVSSNQYRVIRTIETVKKKSYDKESQKQLFKSSAMLFKGEKLDNKFIQICRGSNIVNQEIESILGVYPEVIEKTVYIRQKEVDKLALADPSELRELIKNLFGLNEFDDQIKIHLRTQIITINEDIKDLKFQLGGLVTEQKELEKRKQSLQEEEEKLKIKQNELAEEQIIIKSYPSKEVLYEIKRITDNLDTNRKEEIYIQRMIDNEKENLSVQENRIKDFQHKICEINSRTEKFSSDIKKYPPIRNIKRAIDLSKAIENDEANIKNLISKSNQQIDIDIRNMSIHNLEDIKKTIKTNLGNIQEIEAGRLSQILLLEKYKKFLTTNQILYEIKKNSIEYIRNNDKCPICRSLIQNKKILISYIQKEKDTLSDKDDSIKATIEKIEEKIKEIDSDLENKKKTKQLVEIIETIMTGLMEKRFHFYDEVNSISEFSNKSNDIISLSSDTLNNLLSIIMKIESDISSSKELIRNFIDKLDSEKMKSSTIKTKIDKFNIEKNNTISKIESISAALQKYYTELRITTLDNLIQNFSCKNLDDLILQRIDLGVRLEEKSKVIKTIHDNISFYINDINSRQKRINDLIIAEQDLKEKEYMLRHIQFLIGEVDGFISSDIVEGKLANILMNSTNFYLIPFTERRYEILKIFSTMRKIKDRISHGLILSLMDNKDRVQKSKEQLSGGDESALGLALRISISKLMSTIRPFKDIEKKVPMINFVIMDEPLSSLDEFRRNIIMNILMNDKSFKQIFLISHAEIADESGYRSILITEDQNSQRQIQYIQ